MSSIQAAVSFEKRREVMRKVEHMVAEAEALSKTRNLRREEVHVSDASSSESEGEFADIVNLSPIFNIGIDRPLPQESPQSLRGDVTPRFGNRTKINPRLAFTDEIELEALSAPPQDTPQSKLVSPTVKLDCSITSTGKSVTSTPSTTSFNFYREGPVNSVCSSSKLDCSIASTGKSVTNTPSSATSLKLYRGGAVNSACSTIKPEQSVVSTGKPIVSKISSTSNAATPLTLYQGVPVNSPPFSVESPGIATPESSLAVPTTSSCKTLLDMKKEIGDLTAQFENLEKRTKQCDADPSCEKTYLENAEKAFEEGVEIMERKTDAVIDALHKNLSRSHIIQQDNDKLRSHIFNLEKMRGPKSPAIPGSTEDMCMENQKSLLKPKKTVNHLDPSDEYLQRRYPAVPTTPGTMFVSEFVEVLNLDVGDHTYLSEIMDRQWGSAAPDYVPG